MIWVMCFVTTKSRLVPGLCEECNPGMPDVAHGNSRADLQSFRLYGLVRKGISDRQKCVFTKTFFENVQFFAFSPKVFSKK